MAFSKLFSGYLPEISIYIVQYLRNDLKSLHSCILVNRFLCRVATPLLWEDPFAVVCREEYSHNFLDTYLSFFDEDDQTKLKQLGIMIDSPKKPLFNYPRFIKTLNTGRVELHVVNWINNLKSLPNKLIFPTHHSKVDKLTFSPIFDTENKSLEVKKNLSEPTKTIDFICHSLFNLFMDNDVMLRRFDVKVNYLYGRSLLGVYETILNHPRFLSNISHFAWDCLIDGSSNRQYFNLFQPFLKSLPSLTTSVRHLEATVDQEILSEDNLMGLIRSQRQLSSLSLLKVMGNTSLFDSFKHRSDTLTSIKFVCCDFANISKFDGLRYLSQLESLQFIWCKGLTVQFFQPLLDIPALKIRSLKMVNDDSSVSRIDLLLQKIGPYLENLDLSLFDDTEKEEAFNSIINHCERIKVLYLYQVDDRDLPQLLDMIVRLNSHLRYLSLQGKHPKGRRVSSTSSVILRDLGQVLPDSLEYLDLNLEIEPNDLKCFLDNCDHIVRLGKLLIRNSNTKKIDATFNVLKEFVEKDRANEFAYQVNSYFNSGNLEHQNLEKLIGEIQPSVNMRKYGDLIEEIPDFDVDLMDRINYRILI